MSCYGFRSTPDNDPILLPSDQVTALLAAMRAEQNKLRENVLAFGKVFWEQHAKKTTSIAKYEQALDDEKFWRLCDRYKIEFPLRDHLHDILWSLRTSKGKPRGLQVKDLPGHLAAATSKTRQFSDGSGGVITLDGRKLSFTSGYGNRQWESWERDPVVRVMFAQLARIRWTNGSGGIVVAWHEYMGSGSEYLGAGGSQLDSAYGPRGEKAEAEKMGVSVKKLREFRGRASAPSRRTYSGTTRYASAWR